ncbi:hypothetical protein ABGV43_30910 [Paenibacillus amylolyticus]|uniref:hypothetical protein n=1 Tax=Paenibacillus amylolyticus TaxID=1451 RepID=UPI0032424698
MVASEEEQKDPQQLAELIQSGARDDADDAIDAEALWQQAGDVARKCQLEVL